MVWDSPFEALLGVHMDEVELADEASEMRLGDLMSGASSVLPIKMTFILWTLYGPLWSFMVLSNCEFFEFKVFWDDSNSRNSERRQAGRDLQWCTTTLKILVVLLVLPSAN